MAWDWKSYDLGQQLYWASHGGRVDEVERLLARGAPVNWRGSYGWTALYRACYSNHPDVVKILTQQDGIDVNVQTTNKDTPLHRACYYGYLKCVQVLMATGQCDLDSALVVRILELTLKDEGDVTTKVNENNRLLFACKFGYTAIVRYLINQCNVDVNGAVTSDGLTPLGVAIREGKLDTIKYLITECNVDINRAYCDENDLRDVAFMKPNETPAVHCTGISRNAK